MNAFEIISFGVLLGLIFNIIHYVYKNKPKETLESYINDTKGIESADLEQKLNYMYKRFSIGLTMIEVVALIIQIIQRRTIHDIIFTAIGLFIIIYGIYTIIAIIMEYFIEA